MQMFQGFELPEQSEVNEKTVVDLGKFGVDILHLISAVSGTCLSR